MISRPVGEFGKHGTGAGPHTDGKYAFCAGGDQSVRGHAGYIGSDGVPRLNVLDLQKLIRSMPKVVIAINEGTTRPEFRKLAADAAKSGIAGWEMDFLREVFHV